MSGMAKASIGSDVKTVKAKPERTGVQSLERGFSILETVASEPKGINLADLSKRVGLHTSTTYHLVKTMERCGYVRQSPDKRYTVGSMIFNIASHAKTSLDVTAIATPILEELAQSSGESSHYATMTGGEVVLAVLVAGPGLFQLQEKNGVVRPGHATAVGKVILANLSEADRQRYYATHSFNALTDKTILEEAKLEAELQRVLSDGFAYDDCEFNIEARCVAAPVADFSGNFIGAVGISGPVWRINLQRMSEMTRLVTAAAAQLSESMGG